MTRSNFDPKKFQGRDRVYPAVVGAAGIRRLWVWDGDRKEYRPPSNSKCYLARRWETDVAGKQVRRTRYFETLDEARAWQRRTAVEETATTLRPLEPDQGPKLREVVEAWKATRFPAIARGTQVSYEKLLRLYFEPLLGVPVRAISPQVVDAWLAGLVASRDKYGNEKKRRNFKHELGLLNIVLNHYREYSDDPTFVMPIKRRHRQAVKLRNRLQIVQKDLTEPELKLFATELRRGLLGKQMSAMATLQYYQALRVSEAAALYWEDVRFDWKEPWKSRLFFSRHVCWIRGSREKSYIENGFKNSDAIGGIKEHPMLPQVFDALAELHEPGASGLVFKNDDGTFFAYRQIQHAYDQAFKEAGLPYSGTHVLRHGGTRKTYNETGGDLEIAKQQLGNANLASVLTYAKRSSKAFSNYVDTQWEKARGGRKWSQPTAQVQVVR